MPTVLLELATASVPRSGISEVLCSVVWDLISIYIASMLSFLALQEIH